MVWHSLKNVWAMNFGLSRSPMPSAGSSLLCLQICVIPISTETFPQIVVGGRGLELSEPMTVKVVYMCSQKKSADIV